MLSSAFSCLSLALLLSLVPPSSAISKKQWSKRADHLYLPKEVHDYKTATAPNNVTIRYKNPGLCETTPGVDSYSGYVDITPDVRQPSFCRSLEFISFSSRSTSFSGSSSHAMTRHQTPSPYGRSLKATAMSQTLAQVPIG